MNFNAMGFLLGREMAKRELGSNREDRANQLGLVGAITPDPMMGAVLAMVIARNEGAPAQETTPQTPSSFPSLVTQHDPVELLVGGRAFTPGETLDFGDVFLGSTGSTVPFPASLQLRNPSGPKVSLETDVTGSVFRHKSFKDDNFREGDSASLSLSIDTTTKGSFSEILFVSVNGTDIKFPIRGNVIERPIVVFTAEGNPWQAGSPTVMSFTASSPNKSVSIANKSKVDITVWMRSDTNLGDFDILHKDASVVEVLTGDGIKIPATTGTVELTITSTNNAGDKNTANKCLILSLTKRNEPLYDQWVAVLKAPTAK